MCGRFTRRSDALAVAQAFPFAEGAPESLAPRFNVAPSEPVLSILQEAPAESPLFEWLDWGLLPGWAKDAAMHRPINARAETVHEKPTFRSAFRARRCLVVADGFYEWRVESAPAAGRGKAGKSQKQPMYIHRTDQAPFAFAGLWERWTDRTSGEVVQTCALLTTTPNRLMAGIHDRMPVILDGEEDQLRWLDPAADQEALRALLRPLADGVLAAHPVSTAVNRPGFDDQACVTSLSGPE